jgi:hypothetical protein
MRLSHHTLAATILVAVPAFAQNNTTPTNATDITSGNTVITNEAAANTTAAATTPGVQPAPAPAAATPADTGAIAAPRPAQRTFPWGVLGLVGLIGLLGRRRRVT